MPEPRDDPSDRIKEARALRQRLTELHGRPLSASERAGLREVLMRTYFPHRRHSTPLPDETEAALHRVHQAFRNGGLGGAFAVAMHLGEVELEHEAEHLQDAEETLVAAVKKRLIHWPSMTRFMRLLTALAVAQLLASVFLGVVNATGAGPKVTVATDQNVLVEMSLPVMLVGIVFVSISWAYITVGLAQGHRWLKALGPVLFVVIGWAARAAFATAASQLILGALLLAIVAVAFADELRRFHRPAAPGKTAASWALPTWVQLVAQAVLFLGVYADAWWAQWAVPLGFSQALEQQLSDLTILLVPALLLAGVDYAEWAALVSERGIKLISRKAGRPSLVAVALAVNAVVVAAFVYHGIEGGELGLYSFRLLLAAVVVVIGVGTAIVLARGMRRANFSPRLPYMALVIYAVGSYGAIYLSVLLEPAPPQPSADTATVHLGVKNAASLSPSAVLSAYQGLAYAQASPFGFAVTRPGPWTFQAGTQSTVFTGVKLGDPSYFAVGLEPDTGHSSSSANALTGFTASAASGLGDGVRVDFHVSSVTPDGQWVESQLTGTQMAPPLGAVTGEAWVLTLDQHSWVLVGWSPPMTWSEHSVLFAAMVDSWTPGAPSNLYETLTPTTVDPTVAVLGQGNGVENSIDREQLVQQIFLALMAIGGVVVALWQPKRATPAWLTGTLALAVMATVDWLTGINGFGILADLGSLYSGAIGQTVDGLQLLIALCVISLVAALVAAPKYRRRIFEMLTVITMVSISMVVIVNLIFAGLDLLIEQRIATGEVAIITIALMWDLAMSGETMTNRNWRLLPRRGAMLLYFGYLTMVASVVLYFSGWTDEQTGAALLPQFASDFWPQHGMLEMGVPLIITLALVRLFSRRRSQARTATLKSQPGAALTTSA